MSTRITLIELIDYVKKMSDNREKINKDNIYAVDSSKNNLNEETFMSLRYGEEKTLGNLPKILKQIFDPYINNTIRTGTLHYHNKLNISLIYSILCCAKEDFMEQSNEKKIQYVEEFNKIMVKELYSKNLFKNYEYKQIGWTMKELLSSIRLYKNNTMVLRFLSNFMSLNIFLLNVNQDKIYAIYPEKHYNVYKPSLMLLFYDDIFEPIFYKKNKVWNYKCDPLKKLINIDKVFIGILKINFTKDSEDQIFSVKSEDLLKFLPNEEIHAVCSDDSDNNYDEVYTDTVKNINAELNIDDDETEVDIDTIKNDEDIFCAKNKDDDIVMVQRISTRMKLNELQDLAKTFNIDMIKGQTKNGKDKMKTKAELYEELMICLKNK